MSQSPSIRFADEFPDPMLWRIGMEIEAAKMYLHWGKRDEFLKARKEAWRLIREAQPPRLFDEKGKV